MSWSDRRTFLMMLPAVLAGCGFAPVYGPGGTGSALRGKVGVDAPETDDAYVLVRELEDRLGRAPMPEYSLSYKLLTRVQGQAVTAANETTRYAILGRADYSLTRISDGRIVASGSVDNFTGYSATGTTVETLAAERDARRRLMVMLADGIAAALFATADVAA